jgi:uncharacterized protein Yka (UPF0111/DUF47 family)
MGQRVNIQYSIAIEEMEEEITRIFSKSVTALQQCSQQLKGIEKKLQSKPILSSETVESIADCREELSTIDYMLEDISKIISGYVMYKLKDSAEEEEPALSDEASGQIGSQVDQMKSALSQLGLSDRQFPDNLEEEIEKFKNSQMSNP